MSESSERPRDLLWEDARRGFDALIGEVEAGGDVQKKTGWMSQAWHRRLTWLRWLKELRAYCENQHTMALARIVAEDAMVQRVADARQDWQPTTALELLQHVQAGHHARVVGGAIECSCGSAFKPPAPPAAKETP